MKCILMFFFVVGCFILTKAQVVQLKINKPLSKEDKVAVENLLKNFDPNTYSFSANYINAAGKSEKMTSGSAKGLGSVTMENSKLVTTGVKASTVNTNNVFKASTVNTNNVFKPSDVQLNKMTQLHQILSNYQ